MKYFNMSEKMMNLLIVTILGFSSGLPLALTGTALQAWLAEANIDIVTIGLFGLVSQPYAFKFLWAPILDRFALPLLGYRTGWIFVTQIGLVLTVFALAFNNPQFSIQNMALLSLAIAFLSATQDIAFDAYRTELLSAEERGTGSVFYVYGYRAAMLVSGGGSLLLSYHVGWQSTYIFMAIILGLCSIVTLVAKEPERKHKAPSSLREVVIEPFMEFMTRQKAVILLLFIITYKLGEAFALALTTPFLIKYLGFTTQDVGLIFKTIGVFATLLGLSVGGVLLNRLGLYRGLLWFGILQAITNFLYYLLAVVGHNYIMMAVTILADQFSAGLCTAAFMVLLMTVCNQKYTATQFALLSSIASVARIYVAPASGYLVAMIGWELFFLFSVVMCAPGLLFLRLLKHQKYLQ